jgi:hypothetical protein
VLNARALAWLALGGGVALLAALRAEAALAVAIGLAGGLSLAGSV